MEKDAVKTKAEAEKATIVSAKELEAVKAESDRIRAQYEAAKKAGGGTVPVLSKN